MIDFDERLRAYRIARAEMDLHHADAPAPDDNGEYDDRTNVLCDLHTAAMDALLLTPAKCQREIAQKLRIIVAEEIHDGWHLATPILALVSDDADRLLNMVRT